ncbi:MAG TPA: hypothetical protein VGP47_05375, partial [Parachlamydiaceae bacterium]|nr:hypothetical protein [Parachlamydiaceae bacterium]
TKEEVKKKKGNIRGGPPRDPKTSDYLPDPNAQGFEHTTLGIRSGTAGPYIQGASFGKDGKFKGRTDVTGHGRGDHPIPHYHPATSPNGAKSPAEAITYIH